MSEIERRIGLRKTTHQPAKVRLEDCGRYRSAVVVNVSASGALLRVEGPGRFQPGRRIRLGMTDHQNQVVISLDSMPHATVVRSLGYEDAQHVGIAFDEVQHQLMAEKQVA